MASVSHEPVRYEREQSQWAEVLKIREMWAGIAIVAMWLAVLFDAVYGASFTSSTPGGSSTTIPSVWGVALFAFLGTAAVAKYAFRHDGT